MLAPGEYMACKRKSRYKSFEAADRYRAKRMAAGAKPLGIYLCHYCGGWHLTSK